MWEPHIGEVWWSSSKDRPVVWLVLTLTAGVPLKYAISITKANMKASSLVVDCDRGWTKYHSLQNVTPN